MLIGTAGKYCKMSSAYHVATAQVQVRGCFPVGVVDLRGSRRSLSCCNGGADWQPEVLSVTGSTVPEVSAVVAVVFAAEPAVVVAYAGPALSVKSLPMEVDGSR